MPAAGFPGYLSRGILLNVKYLVPLRGSEGWAKICDAAGRENDTVAMVQI